MSLYLLLSDLHLSDRAPSSCQDGYTDDLFGLLEQTVRTARERKAKAVVWAGDVFHLKSPSRTSHRLVQRTIRLLRSYPCPVFIVPGNHDLVHDQLDSVHQTQPLGVLFESGAARSLIGWANGMYQDDERREYGMMPLYGVPWLQGYGDWGAYDGDAPHPSIEMRLIAELNDYREQVFERGTGSRKVLVIAHAPLYPPGRELKYEYFPAARWAEAMGGAGSVFYGHVHEPHGVWSVDTSQPGIKVPDAIGTITVGSYRGSVTFCNNGALSRGSLHEYNLTRQVGCTLWDSETGEFEFVPLDAKPASEVFRLAEKQQAADMNGRLDEFLASVGSTTLEAVSVEAVIGHIRTLGLGRDAEDLAAELLTEAAHGGK